MEGKEFDTIIIGGGISGIMCARRLREEGKDFLLITKDIGGRITASSDGEVNYGAYYVRSDYNHVLPFVRMGRKIKISMLRFKKGGHSWTLWSAFLKHPVLTTKLYAQLFQFDAHYQKFKKRCEHVSQIEAIEADPYLASLYRESALDFFKRNGLMPLIAYIVDPLTKSTAFLDVEDELVSAACALLLLLIGIKTTHEFILEHEKLVEGIWDRVLKNQVVERVFFEDGAWYIFLSRGEIYKAKHLVSALPINEAKSLLDLNIPTNRPVSVHMAHVRGVLHDEYVTDGGDLILFASHKCGDLVLTKEEDNSYLFYSHNPDYDLKNYFKEHEVVTAKFWHPCFFIGRELIPARFPQNLFVIGDHNVCGMEDAAITGVYAANQIINLS